MKKMNRSFRFFSEYMLMMLGITVASAVLFVLFRGVPLSQKMNVRGFVVCLMVIGGFVEILMEMNGYQLYLSMMLSFGCTRKEFFRGMQLSRLGYIVILLLGGSVCIHLFSAEGWTAAEVLFFYGD